MRILILIIGVLLSGQMAISDEKGVSREEKYQVKLFGMKKSEPIKTGLFFHDGKYIPPPYVVEQFGNIVMINNIVICGPLPYIPRKKIKIPKTLPEVPKNITKETDFDSDIVSDYCSNVDSFVLNRFKNKTDLDQADIIADAYRKLPCVKKVQVENANNLGMELYDGTSLGVRLRPPTRTLMAQKTVDMLKYIKKQLSKSYNEALNTLKKNGVLIGLRGFIPVSEDALCPGKLYEFVKNLNSDKSPREKEAFLKQSFIWEQTADEEVIKAFLKNYEKSKALTQRVESLYRKWKKEHPDEFKRYEIEKRRRPLIEQYNKISGRLEELEDKEEEFYIKGLEKEGKEYRENHKDEREKILKELEKLESKIKQIR